MRRINLLRAHGSPSGYLYHYHGCRCVACRAARAEYGREYRADHVEERAEYHANRRPAAVAYRLAHREERAAYNATYEDAHPGRKLASWHRYKARKTGNGGTHAAADVRAQYKRQKGRCFYCDEKVGKKYHVDHVTPLVKKGSNGPENLVISCPTCNLSKGAQHPMDFAGVMF